MRRSRLILVALPLTLAIAACSSASISTAPPSAGPSTAPSAAASEAAAASTAPSAVPTSAAPSTEPSAAASADNGPTAAPTSLNPCDLVTQGEAATLAGGPVGAGGETTTNNAKRCTYGATGMDVSVFLVQAPSQAALDAGKAQALADMQKAAYNGLKTSRLSGIGDDAALLTAKMSAGTGMTLNAVGIYVVKGLTFFAITDLAINHAVASVALIKAQATTTVGRLP